MHYKNFSKGKIWNAICKNEHKFIHTLTYKAKTISVFPMTLWIPTKKTLFWSINSNQVSSFLYL